MKSLLLIISVVLLVSCNNNTGVDNERGIIIVDGSDEDMNRAIEKAKASVDLFIKAYNEKQNLSNFYIKIPFDNGTEVEHLWASVIEISEKQITGLIENDPNERTTTVKLGDTVSVDKTGISDWMYLDTVSRKIHGAYTIRETRKRLNAEEQKTFDGELEGTLD